MDGELKSYQLANTDEVHSFVKRCMIAAGTEESHAVDLANLLLAADTRGHFSHGINRLGKRIRDQYTSAFCVKHTLKIYFAIFAFTPRWHK